MERIAAQPCWVWVASGLKIGPPEDEYDATPCKGDDVTLVGMLLPATSHGAPFELVRPLQ
jgi:hypothetical protein